jgi:hypothetical protein
MTRWATISVQIFFLHFKNPTKKKTKNRQIRKETSVIVSAVKFTELEKILRFKSYLMLLS